jgi:dTMP kinase
MGTHGIFICIEGLDASGKTTHTHRLVRSLLERGYEALYTTEPSSGQIGKFVRTYILQRKERVLTIVEALLFAVDRVDHVERTIKPAIKEGKIVVSDRYLYSSLAYQGATGLNLNWIEEINKFSLPPDLAIYVDVPPEIVIKRLKRKKSVMENLQTQRRVREVYIKLVKDGRLVLINGNRAMHEVAKDVLSTVLDFLKKRL